jgi:hypothetical protein
MAKEANYSDLDAIHAELLKLSNEIRKMNHRLEVLTTGVGLMRDQKQ